MNSVATEAGNFVFEFNRTGSLSKQNELLLPIPLSGCTINANDNFQATADTFNTCLSALFTNYFYLYSKCKVISSNFPTAIASFDNSLSATFYGFNDVLAVYNQYTNTNVIFGATGSQLYIINDSNGTSIAYQSGQVGYNRNINFVNITSFTYDSDSLYIGDEHYNSVYKLDVSGFTGNNPINNDRVIVQKIIGGSGGGGDVLQFNNPEPLFIVGGELYVFDRGNNYIKIYDTNLNYLRSYSLQSSLTKFPPISNTKPFKYFNLNGNQFIYLLSSRTKRYTTSAITENTISVFNTALELLYTVNLGFSDLTETLQDMYPSTTETNICYVLTNKNLYKMFLSSFSQIGYFNIAKNQFVKVTGCGLAGIENVYLYQLATPGGLFSKFLENINYNNLLANSDFQIYTLPEICVNKDENQTFIVYNKTFIKLLHNTITLLNNISKHPSYTITVGSSLNSLQFNGLTYLTKDELQALQTVITKDFFIGENEIFCNSTINRVITELYDLLLLGLEILSNNVTYNFTPVQLLAKPTVSVLPVGSTIMTESYNSALSSTFVDVILAETGNVLVYETGQYQSLPGKVVDNNVTIVVSDNVTIVPLVTPVVPTTTPTLPETPIPQLIPVIIQDTNIGKPIAYAREH